MTVDRAGPDETGLLFPCMHILPCMLYICSSSLLLSNCKDAFSYTSCSVLLQSLYVVRCMSCVYLLCFLVEEGFWVPYYG